VIRDIPSTYVVEGNKRTSLRQDVQAELRRRGAACNCVRCREVKGRNVDPVSLALHDLVYPAAGSLEHFLSFDTPEGQLAGFLRLSLPGPGAPRTGLTDLQGAAIIREVHVYGQSLPVGSDENGAAQHSGLGRQLIEEAQRIARQAGFCRLAVISAIGTRPYYLRLGFERGDRYLIKPLVDLEGHS
jgi:elongator complex protein 3